MGDGPWRGCSAAPTCWLAGRCGGCGNALLGLAPWQVGRGGAIHCRPEGGRRSHRRFSGTSSRAHHPE